MIDISDQLLQIKTNLDGSSVCNAIVEALTILYDRYYKSKNDELDDIFNPVINMIKTTIHANDVKNGIINIVKSMNSCVDTDLNQEINMIQYGKFGRDIREPIYDTLKKLADPTSNIYPGSPDCYDDYVDKTEEYIQDLVSSLPEDGDHPMVNWNFIDIQYICEVFSIITAYKTWLNYKEAERPAKWLTAIFFYDIRYSNSVRRRIPIMMTAITNFEDCDSVVKDGFAYVVSPVCKNLHYASDNDKYPEYYYQPLYKVLSVHSENGYYNFAGAEYKRGPFTVDGYFSTSTIGWTDFGSSYGHPATGMVSNHYPPTNSPERNETWPTYSITSNDDIVSLFDDLEKRFPKETVERFSGIVEPVKNKYLS